MEKHGLHTAKSNTNITTSINICYQSNVGTRQLSWRVSVTSGIEKPRWIFIAFQTDRNMTQEQNPPVFKKLHVNLEKCYVTLNSKQYPMNEVNSDFQINDYSKIY
jgi:hypothetical protein